MKIPNSKLADNKSLSLLCLRAVLIDMTKHCTNQIIGKNLKIVGSMMDFVKKPSVETVTSGRNIEGDKINLSRWIFFYWHMIM